MAASSSAAFDSPTVPLTVANAETVDSAPRILYSMVARDKTVLCEYAFVGGNFTTVARIIDLITLMSKAYLPELEVRLNVLLGKISAQTAGVLEEIRKSYVYDGYTFHYHSLLTSSRQQNSQPPCRITFLCMADERMGRQRPFKFLEDLKNKFEEQFNYAVVKAAMPLQFNGEMQHSVLATLMEFHNSPEADTITRVRAHIGNIHDNMVENIDNIIKRQEKIELLVEKTDDLNRTATIFRREAADLRRQLWWRNKKMQILFCCSVLLVILLAGMWVCGGPSFKSCRASSLL